MNNHTAGRNSRQREGIHLVAGKEKRKTKNFAPKKPKKKLNAVSDVTGLVSEEGLTDAPHLSIKEIFALLRTSESGLDAREASTRMMIYGPNVLTEGKTDVK